MAIGLLIIRLVVGPYMLGHGLQKMFGWLDGPGLRSTAESFEKVGYRPGLAMALVAASGEVASGVSLGAGFLTAAGGAALLGVMINAASLHWMNGLWIQHKGIEYTVVLGAIGVAYAFMGPGAYSIDAAASIHHLSGNLPGVIATSLGLLAGLATLARREWMIRKESVRRPDRTTMGSSG